MANSESRTKSYPAIPAKNWWQLRKKFQGSVPSTVSLTYLTTTLGVGEVSGKKLLGYLKTLGLLDDSLKPTQVAFDWRSDSDYINSCNQMFEIVYPDELRHIDQGDKIDRQAVKTWFERDTRKGTNQVDQYVSMYALLRYPSLEGAKETRPVRNIASPKNTKPSTRAASSSSNQKTISHTPQLNAVPLDNSISHVPAIPSSRSGLHHPNIHLDIQIHISPESSNEQIESIFKNMSKYIFNHKEDN